MEQEAPRRTKGFVIIVVEIIVIGTIIVMHNAGLDHLSAIGKIHPFVIAGISLVVTIVIGNAYVGGLAIPESLIIKYHFVGAQLFIISGAFEIANGANLESQSLMAAGVLCVLIGISYLGQVLSAVLRTICRVV